MMRVSVMPYVWKYLYFTYGATATFSLKEKSDLRISFENLPLTAMIVPQAERLPGKWIQLDLGDDPALLQLAQMNAAWLSSGAFFQHEFFLHLRQYIEAQRDVAVQLGLKESEWNARIGLESFLRRYHIEEYEYSYESLRRQWTRINAEKFDTFFQTKYKKFDFCTSDNQHFTCCSMTMGKKPRIYFSCYSRGEEDIVTRYICIPARLIEKNEHLEWCYVMMNRINRLLVKGYTIA
jgi:hypothetical protein